MKLGHISEYLPSDVWSLLALYDTTADIRQLCFQVSRLSLRGPRQSDRLSGTEVCTCVIYRNGDLRVAGDENDECHDFGVRVEAVVATATTLDGDWRQK